MWKQLSILGLAGLSYHSLSYAQDTNTEGADDSIIVYGVRLEQALTEVGSSVTVITAEEIEAMGVEYVLDAVATAPGVTINQNGTFGGSASVRIRGASSEQTLVIIDGVVVNDPTSPGGGYNFARLDPANVERIEILKGPQSTLWGTDAIGGVVNIITRQPVESFEGSAFAQFGSFSSLRGGVSVGGANAGFDYRLAYSGHTTDGISKADEANGNDEDDDYDSTTLSGSLGYNFAVDARLQAQVLWTDADSEFDSFSFGDQGNVADGDELSQTEELSANVSLSFSGLDGRLQNDFLVGRTEIERENFTDGVSSFASEGDRDTLRYQGTLSIDDRNQLAFGAEREETESNGDDTSIDGLFALYELKPAKAWTLSAGVRRDDHERFGAETTGRFAAAYNPTKSFTLTTSWGEGFKAPTLFQTTFFCCGATEPNADLQPETSRAWDLGAIIRSDDGRGELGLTYFDQDTTNLITFSFAVGGYENIAKAESTGFELFGGYQVTDWLGVSGSVTRIDATDGDGTELVRVPEVTADVAFTINPQSDLSGSLFVRYNGEEQDANGEVASWTRVDVSGSYQMTDTVELYARIENLLDEEYQQILGYGTPGTSGYIGVRFGF